VASSGKHCGKHIRVLIHVTYQT